MFRTQGGTTNTQAGITEPLHHGERGGGGGGVDQHTSAPTWASEPTVSERCFSWKQRGWKYQRRKRRMRRRREISESK